MRTVTPSAAEATRLADEELATIVRASRDCVAYDARYGGTTGTHKAVVMLSNLEPIFVARPDASRAWKVEKFEFPPEHAGLQSPDFVAGGERGQMGPRHAGHQPIVVASGGKIAFLMALALGSSGPTASGYSWSFASAGLDLTPLVGPDRAGYRIFVEPTRKVHVLPEAADGPDPSRPGYSLMFRSVMGYFRGQMTPRKLV